MELVDIPVADIKVLNRLRKTDAHKIQELAESIKDIGLLHPIAVAEKDNEYVLLSGEHRLSSYKLLEKPTIPCVVRENNPLINQLVEVSENLCSNRLNAIEESNAIVMREKILIKLGRKAVVGSNQYTEDKITNTELANQLGISRRVYQYKKSVANLNPKVQAMLGETKFANSMMDMVKLSKQPVEVQKEVATILVASPTKTFRQAFITAKLRLIPDAWSAENRKLKEEILSPKSIMKFDRKKDKLNDICRTVSHNEALRRPKKTALFGTNEVSNYTMLPEHSRWFIKYFSNEGDVCADNSFGRGTNILAAAYEGRKVIGFDLNKNNVECVREALDKYIPKVHHELFHSCGVEMVELGEAQNVIDLFINDIPYILSAEKYNDDPRDLCNTKDLDQFYGRVEVMMKNMKRLIKPSNYEKGIFKPIIMKVGSQRRGKKGLIDMATDIEMIARRIGLTLHDKIFNELNPAMQSYIINTTFQKRFTMKIQETNLVFVKYE
jgi:ParB/RepB/Spo0J family partition protein